MNRNNSVVIARVGEEVEEGMEGIKGDGEKSRLIKG